MKKRTAWSLALAGSASAAIVVALTTRPGVSSRGPVSSGGAEPEHGVERLPSPSVLGGAELPDERAAAAEEENPVSSRTAAVAGALEGRVVDASGAAVAGAEVTWFRAMDGAPEDTDLRRLADQWQLISRHVLTDDDGRFAFDAGPQGPEVGEDSLWITSPGFSALEVPSPLAGASLDPLRLESVEPRSVLVTDASGHPLPGVEVVQAVFRAPGCAIEGPPAFARRGTTDVNGAWIPASPPEGLFDAFQSFGEDRASEPACGSAARRQVHLIHAESFTVVGRVFDCPLQASGEEASFPPHVLYGADAEPWVPFGRAPVAEDGTWGPLLLATAGENEGFTFRLEGGGLVPQLRSVRGAVAGDVISVDFAALPAVSQWFLVIDQDESPLPDAELTVSWEVEGRTVSTSAQAREDGYLWIGDIRPGAVQVTATCEGYTTHTEPQNLPVEGASLAYVLTRFAPVHGRCMSPDGPLLDFTIAFWPAGIPVERRMERFTGREDGSFEIQSVPAGEVEFAAYAEGYGPSPVVLVQTERLGEEELVLRTQYPRAGRGRVIDARTTAPLMGALVQAYSARGISPIDPQGQPSRSGQDGTFEVDNLTPDSTLVRVAMVGFADEYVRPVFRGDVADLGTVALRKPKRLIVQLERPRGRDPSHYSVEIPWLSSEPPRSFDETGRVVFENVMPGPYQIRVRGGEHEATTSVATFVPPSSPDDVHLSVHLEGVPVTVKVEAPEGEELPINAEVYVYYLDASRHGVTSSLPLVAGDMVFDPVPAGPMAITVHDPASWQAMARRWVTITETGENRFDVPLGSIPLTVRVLDARHEPLRGAMVAFSASDARFMEANGQTDTTGTCHLHGLDRAISYVVRLSHPKEGLIVGREVVLPVDPEDVLELELRAEQRISVILRDGDDPVVGATCRLLDPFLPYEYEVLPSRATDESGTAAWRQLGSGAYRLRVDDESIWPIEVQLDVAETPRTLQVRRRGSIELTVLNREGLPLSSAVMRVRSQEFGDWVSDWISSRSVGASDPELRTDDRGSLTLEGLPRGLYRWFVDDATAGADAQGTFEVRPRERDVVTLRVSG